MFAPMLDQLNPILTASNVRAWTTDAFHRKNIETKQTCAVKVVLVKVDLCSRRKRHFFGINLQAFVDGNLRVITAAVNEFHEQATAALIC